MFRRWRRIDQVGLELARIDIEKHGVTVASTLVDGSGHPFSLRYIWTLTPQWRTRTLRIEHMNGDDRWLTIDRVGDSSWRLDNKPAPHLEGCTELDLSATPFCNTLAMRLLGRDGALTADEAASVRDLVSLRRMDRVCGRPVTALPEVSP